MTTNLLTLQTVYSNIFIKNILLVTVLDGPAAVWPPLVWITFRMVPPLFHSFLQKGISHWDKLLDTIIHVIDFYIEWKSGGAIRKPFCDGQCTWAQFHGCKNQRLQVTRKELRILRVSRDFLFVPVCRFHGCIFRHLFFCYRTTTSAEIEIAEFAMKLVSGVLLRFIT